MRVSVISAPSAVVLPIDARAAGVFTSDDLDVTIAALLAAAQGTLDGPDGWLGRSLGPQTLEATIECRWLGSTDRRWTLVCPPIRSIVSVKYTDSSCVEQIVDPSTYTLSSPVLTFSSSPPSFPLRIRYTAGYDGDLICPAPIRQAIMLMAAQLKGTLGQGQVIREDVTGVGSTLYAMPAASAKVLQDTAEMLLSTFRVFN